MFDLNIDHYTKNELEDLFDLDSKVYSNVDLEKNLASLKEKIELEEKIDSQTKEKTLNFLLTKKLAIRLGSDLHLPFGLMPCVTIIIGLFGK